MELRARVEVVVVVSAMSGVTNQLIEAATQFARAGDAKRSRRFRGIAPAARGSGHALIHSVAVRIRVNRHVEQTFERANSYAKARLCSAS